MDLKEKNLMASKHAGQIIFQHFTILQINSEIGRLISIRAEFREFIIDFGESGHMALYRIEFDGVYILEFRHQKEAGYHKKIYSTIIREL